MTTIENLARRAFEDSPENPIAATHALAVMRNGELVFERYADGFDADSTFISWSMAKSMTSALCGVLVDRGEIDIDAPAPIAEWQSPGDPRREITLRHLLEMRSGLAWNEDYIDGTVSDVIEMLASPDMAALAAAKPLEHEPGTHFYYSSGTTNLIARILGDHLGGRDAMETALHDLLFSPAGMVNPIPKFDKAGTFVGSSFVYAPARDFLAFGELFRNGGMAGDQRVLSQGWIDASVTEHSVDEESGQGYGLQWWLVRDEHGSYACNGYEGQRIQVVPDLGLTFVRLGKTDADYSDDLRAFYAEIVEVYA